MFHRFALIFALAFAASPALAQVYDPADGNTLTDDAPFTEEDGDDEAPLTDELESPVDAPPAAAEELDEAADGDDGEFIDDGLPPPVGEVALTGFVSGLVGGGATVGVAAALVIGTGFTTIMALSCCSAPRWTYGIAEIGFYTLPLLLPLLLAVPPLVIAASLYWTDAGMHAIGAAAVFSGLAFVVLAPIVAGLTGFATLYAAIGGVQVASPLGHHTAVIGGMAGAAVGVIGVSLLTGLVIGGIAAGGAAWGGTTDEARALLQLDDKERFLDEDELE